MKTHPATFRNAERQEKTTPVFIYYVKQATTQLYLASYDRDVTVNGWPVAKGSDPQTFVRAQVANSFPEETADLSSKAATVSAAVLTDDVRKFFVTAPTDAITVEIYRVNASQLPSDVSYSQDLYMQFSGECTEVRFEGFQVLLSFVSALHEDNERAPRFFYQKQCNWPLYGTGCAVNKDSHKIATTVQDAQRIKRYVDISQVAAHKWVYQGGFLTLDSTAEKVGIVAQEILAAGAGTRLFLQWWPTGLADGVAITVYKGCRHTVTACNDDFANLANFGGTPYIPTYNPAVDGVTA